MAKRNKEKGQGEEIAQAIIEKYQPETIEEMQEAIKDIFGPMIESLLQGELDNHLGYASGEHGSKGTENRRNGYTL